MIYLHKFLPVILLPIGITVLLVLMGLVLRRRVLCWLGIAVLWIASTPLVGNAAMRAAEGWQERQPLSSVPVVQAIVVLSGGRVQPPGDPTVNEWTDSIDRFYGGVELYKAGKASLLIFTGVWLPWRPNARSEGDIWMEYAVDLGVPHEHVMTTDRSVNTAAEARAVADLLADVLGTDAVPHILLVTSAYHMRRAQLLFARAGFDVYPFPVDFQVAGGRILTILDFLPNAASLGHTETALRELYGLLFYYLLPQGKMATHWDLAPHYGHSGVGYNTT